MIFIKSSIYLVLISILPFLYRTRCETISDIQIKNTIQFFGEYYVTSCLTLLYIQEDFTVKANEIYWMIYHLASELQDYYVTSMSFPRFLKQFSKWKKMSCNSPLLVVTHSDNATKHELKKVSHSRLFHMTSWLLFMTDKSDMKDFFEDIRTPFDLRFIVAQVKSENFIEFFEVYRVVDGRPLRTPKFGNWSLEEGFKVEPTHLYQRRKNLEGIVLRTGSTDNYPMHYLIGNPDGKLVLHGFLGEVWRELERTLNFTSVNYPSVDRVTGIPEENGNWNGLVGMLQRGEIDVAVSIFIMDELRSHVIDFTRPLIRTSYQIFYRSLGSSFRWDAILRPFKTNIWVTIIVWIIISSLFSWMCNTLSHKYKIEKKARKEDFNLINSFLFFTKALCNQGHFCVPSSAASRIVFLTAYMVAGVLVPSYSAALIYFLTSRTPVRPFDSLRELLHIGTYRLQTISKTAHYTYFSNSTNPLLKKVFYELIAKIPENELPLSMAEAFEKLCTQPNLAHFGDMANAMTYIDQVNNYGGKCKIMSLSREISSIYSCMGLVRDSPYKLLIDYYLIRMTDLGIVDKLKSEILPLTKYQRKSRTWGVINSTDVFQAFAILSTGMILSIFVLIMEMLHSKLKSHQEKKKKDTPAFRLRKEFVFHLKLNQRRNTNNFFVRPKVMEPVSKKNAVQVRWELTEMYADVLTVVENCKCCAMETWGDVAHVEPTTPLHDSDRKLWCYRPLEQKTSEDRQQ